MYKHHFIETFCFTLFIEILQLLVHSLAQILANKEV